MTKKFHSITIEYCIKIQKTKIGIVKNIRSDPDPGSGSAEPDPDQIRGSRSN